MRPTLHNGGSVLAQICTCDLQSHNRGARDTLQVQETYRLLQSQIHVQTCIQIANVPSTTTGVPMGPKETVYTQRISTSVVYDERRRFQRIHLQIPLFVRGKDAHGEQFLELAKTLDISGLGAFVTCPRALRINEVVTLTIPAPSITSSALVPAGMPPIQARVKRQQAAGDVYLVGVEFLKPIG
jgi:hypothetical protein